MSKKILFCAALVLAIFAGAAQKRQVMLDRVVAVVGGSSILWSEVDEYAGELVEQRRQQGYTSDRDPHDEALEQLLMQKLLFNQALIDSVDVSYSGIAQRVEAHLQALIDDAGSIAALETKQHMPIFNVREMLRQRYEEQAYAQAMQSSVVGKIKVIPGEVERYYKKTDPDSLPTIPEQYVYAQITRFPASIKEAKQRTKERLLDMRERTERGNTSGEQNGERGNGQGSRSEQRGERRSERSRSENRPGQNGSETDPTPTHSQSPGEEGQNGARRRPRGRGGRNRREGNRREGGNGETAQPEPPKKEQ